MIKTKYIHSFLLFLLLSVGTILRGQPPIPPRPNPPRLVNDFANLMSIDEQMRLERQLVAYNDSTSTQIAIVTIADMGDYDIFDWAIEIGKKWGIGQAQKNNGIVILVGLAPKRKVFIATGGGVQGFLPDVICKRIIDQHIVPNFKEKRFYDGFNAAFEVIRAAAKGEFVNEKKDNQSGGDVFFWVIIGIFILLIIFIIYMNNRRGRYAQYTSRRRTYGNDGGGFIFWNGGGGFGGGSDWGGGSDSGSFGGFGGGDFDGGGAGGDW
ncbi:MAG: TPM domain-containing protein [Saprospiraceae bacterium]|nr:TPM domain-containing protein [Saprospiraceae bacterium]